MRELAEKLNLKFIGNPERSWKERFFSYSVKKNIIQGEYNNKKIEIFDFDSITKHVNNPIINSILTFKFGKNPIHVTYINGKLYKDKYLPYLAVDKIEKLLTGQICLEEYNRIFFNKGVFLVTILTSFSITFVVGYYFYSFYSASMTKILIFAFLVNVAMVYLSYRIAKKTNYKVLIKDDPRNTPTS